jgi:hypothetical protein
VCPERSKYIAGECNIGEKEVAVRKKMLIFFLPLLALITFLSLRYCQSIFCWLGLLTVSFLSIVVYLEIRFRFCILFGFFNLYNFQHLGNLSEVKEKCDCNKDRRRVAKIILQSLFASLAYASIIHLVSVNYHF